MAGFESNVKPKLPADKKLSKKHHKQSVRFNLSHAKDHLKEAAKHEKALGQPARKLSGFAAGLMRGKA